MISTRICSFILLSCYWTLSVEENCDADAYADGCSVPLGLDTPFKKTFTKACNKHDICYGCVSSSDINIYVAGQSEVEVCLGRQRCLS